MRTFRPLEGLHRMPRLRPRCCPLSCWSIRSVATVTPSHPAAKVMSAAVQCLTATGASPRQPLVPAWLPPSLPAASSRMPQAVPSSLVGFHWERLPEVPTMPRIAWVYIYALGAAGEYASGVEASLTTQHPIPRTRTAWISVLRKASDLSSLVDRVYPLLRQWREAVVVELEALASGDKELLEMARDDLNLVWQKLGGTPAPDFAASTKAGGDSRPLIGAPKEESDLFDEMKQFVSNAVDDSDSVSRAADRWTLETMGRAGGEEASIFAAELFDMYKRYCEDVRGWRVEQISDGVDDTGATDPGAGGASPDVTSAGGAMIRITGKDVFKYLQYEIGVHRVQRVPTTEASGRMQTSTASVTLMPQPSPVSVNVREEDCNIEMTRGSGPGGQGVNSSSNACKLYHRPSGTVIRCHYHRSGVANRELALDMLAQKLWKEAYRKAESETESVFSKQWTSGERAERIRTYHYVRGTVLDHRGSGWECSGLTGFMRCTKAADAATDHDDKSLSGLHETLIRRRLADEAEKVIMRLCAEKLDPLMGGPAHA